MKRFLFASLLVLIMSNVNAQKFTYKFGDSSVPPPYHRSYSITVEKGTVQFRVYDYENDLLSETYTITDNQWKDFTAAVKKCKLAVKKEATDDGGCAGGTTDTFIWTDNKGTEYTASNYNCGGSSTGNLSGNAKSAVTAFQNMVPDFDLKLAGTRN